MATLYLLCLFYQRGQVEGLHNGNYKKDHQCRKCLEKHLGACHGGNSAYCEAVSVGQMPWSALSLSYLRRSVTVRWAQTRSAWMSITVTKACTAGGWHPRRCAVTPEPCAPHVT